MTPYVDGRKILDDSVTMLAPYRDSVGVQVHPRVSGDVVTEVFIDAATGKRYIIARDPETAYQLGTDLVQATTDPAIAAEADQIRAAQRDS